MIRSPRGLRFHPLGNCAQELLLEARAARGNPPHPCIPATAAQRDFYVRVLALRMREDRSTDDRPSHLFYADEGQPGADLTFFEYPARGPAATAPSDPPHLVPRRERRRADVWAAGSGRVTRSALGYALRSHLPRGLGWSCLCTTRATSADRRRARHPGRAPLRGFAGCAPTSPTRLPSRRLLRDVLVSRRSTPALSRVALALAAPRLLSTHDRAPEERGSARRGTVHHIAGPRRTRHRGVGPALRAAGRHTSGLVTASLRPSTARPARAVLDRHSRPGFATDERPRRSSRLALPPKLEPCAIRSRRR